jgi:dipeptidyl aminopeptidase/acylaminoacyl peptidase
MKKILALSALVCAVSSVSLFAQKRAITHEDVWLMKRTGSPAPSPDGKWVVFSVTEPSYDADKNVSDLWIVPADGRSPARRLTGTKAGESGAAWSPDSTRIAFSAKRDGDEAAQIYVLRLDGGEAERVTYLSTGTYAPKWRPDGKAILFQSMVYPGAADDEANKKIAADRKARKYKTRVYETFPFMYWDRWLEDLRPHIFVQTLEAGAKAKDLLAGTKLAAARGFDGPHGLGSESDLGAVWSPDGQSIVFAASTDADTSAFASTTEHLFRVAASGGAEPEQLTNGKLSYARPAFRPDGKALYAVQQRSSDDDLYSHSRLVMIPWGSKEGPVTLTAKWDRSVDGFAFAPDSRTVYLFAEDDGRDRLFRLPASGGDVKAVMEAPEGSYTGLAIPAKAPSTLVFASWSAMTQPPEVVSIDASTGKHKLMTNFNAERLAALDLPAPKHFWFTDSKGKKIHSLVVLPPNMDKSRKYPLLVFPHGGPHSMSKDNWFIRWNYHLLTSPGYVLLMTNYTGSTGFGEEFAASIHKDVLRGPGREILEAVDAAAKEMPFIDTARMAGVGASYGGYLMAWFEGNTDRFKCLVNHAGLIDNISMWGATDGAFYWERRNGGPVWEMQGQWVDQNPMKYAANFKTPMLVTHGERDFRVPVSQGFQMYKLLQRQRVPARFVVFPDENHWIQNGHNAKQHMTEVLDWLGRYLK